MLEARLLVSSHRHGNDLGDLHAAIGASADLVEVDVHLFWGRVEARHEKTLGPLPVLWDRGTTPRWRGRRLRFDEVVAAAPPETILHVDLKGWSPRLGRRVRAALGSERTYVVSTRSWWLLRPFRSIENVTVMRSIGAGWQLRWFLFRHPGGVTDAVCIRSDRLSSELAALLTRRCPMLFVWRVESVEHAHDLVALGVRGLIVDDLDVVRTLVSGPARPAPDDDEPEERERGAGDRVDHVVIRRDDDRDAHERRAHDGEAPHRT